MASPRPRFSIVSAVYNVEPYLPDFIASIEAQRFDLGRVEVIAVDDGSTDGSRGILEDWARRRPGLVTVLSQPNGGQASARNLGLEHATGEWVTFSDPDDMLDREFLAVADRFAAAHPDVEVLGAKPVVLDEATGRLVNHARHRQYRGGSRRADLGAEPNTFPGRTNVCLFRLDRVRAAELRFDTRLRPVFEDVHFTARYLLLAPDPVVGILPDARYVYRRRATNDSTLQRGWSHPGRFTDVLELGHLDLLRRARNQHGSVPGWVQHLVIYDLSWYLSEDEKVASAIRIADDVAPRFHELFAEIVRHLDPATVRAHTARPLRPHWSDVLAHASRPEPWHSSVAARTKVDEVMELQRIAHRFVGPAPVVEYVQGGRPVEPAYAKVMAYHYFGRPLLFEHIAWLPLRGRLEVRLDGRPAEIVGGWPRPGAVDRPHAFRGGTPTARVPGVAAARSALRRARRAASRVAAAAPRLLARVAALLQVPRRLGAHRQDPRRGRQRRTPLRTHPRRAAGHQRVVRRGRRHAGLVPAARRRRSTTRRPRVAALADAHAELLMAHLLARGRPSRRAA